MRTLTKAKFKKFREVNDKIRQEEIRARKLYLNLLPNLEKMIEDKVISDYEIEERYSLFNFNTEFCESKNIEIGDPFYESKSSISITSDDDFFYSNWNECSWNDKNILKKLHFGHTMHCLVFDECDISIDDILAINNFTIELVVRYQFIMEKA